MSKHEEFEIHSDMVKGIQRITISGSLIYGQTDRVKEKVLALLGDSNGCLIDLRKLHLIDSTGFGVLVSIAKKLKENQHRVVIILTDKSLYHLFTITKMQLIFTIVETEDEALQVLQEEIAPKLSIEDY